MHTKYLKYWISDTAVDNPASKIIQKLPKKDKTFLIMMQHAI